MHVCQVINFKWQKERKPEELVRNVYFINTNKKYGNYHKIDWQSKIVTPLNLCHIINQVQNV